MTWLSKLLGIDELVDELDELNSQVAKYTKLMRKNKKEYPVLIEPGMYYPSEDDVVGSDEMSGETRKRALYDPYRAWEVFDGEEEEAR